MSHTGEEGGDEAGEGGEGGEGGKGGSEGGEGGEGSGGGGASGGGASGGASWWIIVTLVYTSCPKQNTAHVVRSCGGEDESRDWKYAPTTHVPSPSRSLVAVVLGASVSKIQPVSPLLPPQSGSQYSQKEAPSAL